MCSPGCFSLFRGSALMDDHVLRTYCTKSLEARHYVQYDQGWGKHCKTQQIYRTESFLGEDRWLCTLLLQEGYRVEYCAASDALTYAPESFHVRSLYNIEVFEHCLSNCRSFSISVVDGFHLPLPTSSIFSLNTRESWSSTIAFRISTSSINCFWWFPQCWAQQQYCWWSWVLSMLVLVCFRYTVQKWSKQRHGSNL